MKHCFLVLLFLITMDMRYVQPQRVQNGRVFRNPIIDGNAPDPTVFFTNGTYYMTFTNGDHIEVRQSHNLVNWRSAKAKRVYSPEGRYIWSPEMHFIYNKLYIYFSDSDSQLKNHRIAVIEAEDATKPMGAYKYVGKLADPNHDFWASDPTILQHNNGKTYLLYSGWDNIYEEDPGNQQIYIAEMTSPISIKPSSTRKLASPMFEWEQVGRPVLQGPAILEGPGHYFLVYSASLYSSPDHCMGMMFIPKNEDMLTANWTRLDQPVFRRNDRQDVYGPGQASYTVSPDENETWMLYHAMSSKVDEGRHRIPRAQQVIFDEAGFPVFPIPAGFNTDVDRPGRVNITTFRNPITDFKGADPWVLLWDSTYYFIRSVDDLKLRLYRSKNLGNWDDADYVDIFTPPANTMYSKELWAPEIHYTHGNFYVYFAADDGDNLNHRMYALQADDPNDPMGTYTFKGKVADPMRDWWAIDGTLLNHENGNLYWIYSGWDGAYTEDPKKQHMYIAQMSDPLTVILGSSVLFKSPSYEWEQTGQAVIEGASIIENNDTYFMMYSAAGSWTPDYVVAMMGISKKLNPLNVQHWWSADRPVLSRNDEQEVYGVGHASFTKSPDGSEDWIVYHGMDDPEGRWANRSPRAQRFHFGPNGLPVFPPALGFNLAQKLPSGTDL